MVVRTPLFQVYKAQNVTFYNVDYNIYGRGGTSGIILALVNNDDCPFQVPSRSYNFTNFSITKRTPPSTYTEITDLFVLFV